MASTVVRLQHGPLSCKVSSLVDGGQLVEPDPGSPGKVRVAGAGSVTWLGVALEPGAPVGSGAPLNFVQTPETVSVARGCEVKMTYDSDAAYGDVLVAAANGRVTKAGASPAFPTVVGQCTDPRGATAGSRARTWIR